MLRGENRIFKVSRIQDLSVNEDIFSAEEIDNSYEDFTGSYSWRDSSEKVILKFYPRAFGTVEDFFYRENILRKEKDYWIVETNFPIDGWVQGFILIFGEDAEVIEPASLRKKILEKAEKVRDVYIQKNDFQS